MYLKVKNYQDGGLVYDTGERVMRDRGVVLFGMSPGNPYFKRHVIEKYVEFLGREHRKIVVIVPQEPSEHTYRAMSSKDAVGRAKKNAGRLRTHCKKAIEKVSSISNLPGDFHFVDWPREVGTHEVYLEKLDDMLRLYRTNALFRQDAAMMTARALGKNPRDETSDGESADFDSELDEDDSIQEGVQYILKEFAYILASKALYGTDQVSVIYHRPWAIYEKFINGEYDGKPRHGYGLCIIC